MADPAAIDDLAGHLANIESGGNYGAQGPVTKHGDRAYGKYQVMGANIPAWTREATGVEATPDAFLADPDLQERTVKHRLTKYYDEFGNARDVASMWHSGVPYKQAVAEGRADQLGTTTEAYANRATGTMTDAATGGAFDVANQTDDAAPPPPRVAVVTAPDGRKARVTIPSGASPEDIQASIKAVTDHMVAPTATATTATATSTTPAEAAPHRFWEGPSLAAGTDFATDPRFNTTLAPDEEARFQQWKAQYAPQDSGADYDLRGAFKAGVTPDPTTGHFPDTFKKPNHPTFSDQSQYASAAPERAGSWQGDRYVPPHAAAEPTPVTEQTPMELGRSFNLAAGRDANSKIGMYTAEATLPLAQTMEGVYDAFTKPTPGVSGDPRELATWMDGLDRALKILRPIGVVGEMAQNIVARAAEDNGAPPYVAAALGFIAGAGVGAMTPIPGLKAKPGSPTPLAGTATSRAAAAETATAAETGERVATQMETGATSARATAEDAARQADEAAAAVAPSPAAKVRAEAELTPSGTTPLAGGRAATAELGKQLEEITEPVKGIYNAVVTNADTAAKALGPKESEMLLGQLDAVRTHFGNVYAAGAQAAEGATRDTGTLPAAAREVFDRLETALTSGENVSARLVDDFKQQLDDLFPGKVPYGASPMEKQLYEFKWQTRDALRTMFEGDDKAWAEAADHLYRAEIVGKGIDTALGPLTRLAKKNPATFVERVFGNGTSDKHAMYAGAIMKRLKGTPAAQSLQEATLARAVGKATDTATGALDPKKLLSNIGKYNQEFYNSVVGKQQQTFFDALKQEQAAVGETAAAAHRGAQWATTAEREAGLARTGATKAQTAAEKAAADAGKPNRLAYLGAAGIEFAAHKLGVGQALGAAEVLGLLATKRIAQWLADSKMANLLARAIRTTADSPAAVTVASEIRQRQRQLGLQQR